MLNIIQTCQESTTGDDFGERVMQSEFPLEKGCLTWMNPDTQEPSWVVVESFLYKLDAAEPICLAIVHPKDSTVPPVEAWGCYEEASDSPEQVIQVLMADTSFYRMEYVSENIAPEVGGTVVEYQRTGEFTGKAVAGNLVVDWVETYLPDTSIAPYVAVHVAHCTAKVPVAA